MFEKWKNFFLLSWFLISWNFITDLVRAKGRQETPYLQEEEVLSVEQSVFSPRHLQRAKS